MTHPFVVVVEHPDGDPSVHVVGNVEVVQASAYPASAYNTEPGDYTDYPADMRALADRATAAGSYAAAAELRGLADEFERRWATPEA